MEDRKCRDAPARASEVNGPDFLGIGVGRAGTTYLYERLRARPRVWLPPLKELHFFDRDVYGWPAGSGRSVTCRCRLLLATVRRHEGTWKNRADLHFAWRHLSGNLDSLASYRRCFPELGEHIVKGEITPDYCELDAAQIADIKRAFPELKLLLTLRHPLHRFESQVYKYLAEVDQPSALEDVRRWLERSAFVDSFDYVGIIARWSKVFGTEKLHLAYFERLENDADGYVDDICRFLGMKSDCIAREVPVRVNSSRLSRSDQLPRDLIRARAATGP